MTTKELKRLSRMELLQLLLVQTQETERLKKDNEELKARLECRTLQVTEAGNIAEATMKINGVMEAAQKAADQYLDNARAMEARTKRRCEELLAQAQEQADRIIREAKDTRKKIIEKKRRNR